jgi:hypothetical protein
LGGGGSTASAVVVELFGPAALESARFGAGLRIAGESAGVVSAGGLIPGVAFSGTLFSIALAAATPFSIGLAAGAADASGASAVSAPEPP